MKQTKHPQKHINTTHPDKVCDKTSLIQFIRCMNYGLMLTILFQLNMYTRFAKYDLQYIYIYIYIQ